MSTEASPVTARRSDVSYARSRFLNGLCEGCVLGQYALHIGLALVALIAALAAWAVSRKRRSIRREDEIYIGRSAFERALETLRHELQQSIEASQATASRAAEIGEKVIAAVKPIEVALRDLSGRIAELEWRAEASDELSADLKSSLRAQDSASEENARAVEGINVRLGGFEQQLIAVFNQLSNLKQVIEGMAVRNDKNSEELRTINTSLAAVQSQMDDLSQCVNLGERGLTDLSIKTESIAESVASLKSSSQQAEQQLADGERRLASKLAEPEAVPNGPPTAVNGISTEDVKDAGEYGSPGFYDQTSPGDGARDGDDGTVGAPGLSNAEGASERDKGDRKKQTIDTTCGRRPTLAGRGGSPRGERDATDQPGQPVEKASRPRFQLVVTRDSGDWEIFAEVESTDSSNLRVTQGSEALHESVERSLFGPLRDLTAPIRILSDDVEVGRMTLITQESPLLFFRLQRDLGRLVPRPSRGLNLAMVPSEWQFDERRSGAPPFEPESCGVPGYSAHFLSVEKNPALVFKRPNAAAAEFYCAMPKFRLEGDCLLDAEDRMGLLFTGTLLVLQGEAGAMEAVRAIVLGAEGPGKGRWRQQYDREASDAESWPLPDDVRAQGSGWYFIRLYDVEDDLIDSFAFRYIGGLKSIDVEGAGLTQGLDEIRVTFAHDEGVSVVITDSILSSVEHSTAREPRSTLFAWPCHPGVREPIFEVRDGGKPVPVTLDTDRVWWALVNEPRASEPAWQSSPVQLMPEHCAPESDAELLVRFPRSAAVDAFIGFNSADRRKIPIGAGRASVQLHGFSDASELRRFGEQKLKLWVCANGSELELDVAKVSVSMKCPWCETHMIEQEEMLGHLLSRHHESCFERLDLTGEELIKSGIPRYLLVCPEDGQYYPDSPLPEEKALRRMESHYRQSHPDVASLKYLWIGDPQQIRNLLGLREKWVWKCKLGSSCHPIAPTSDDQHVLSDKKGHLRDHLNDLLAGIVTEV
jgi:hypothetical protein